VKRPAKASPAALLHRRAFYLRLPREKATRRDVSPLSSIDIAGIAHRARDGNDPRGEPEFVERSMKGREIPMWTEPRKPYEFSTHRL
jgi:hypothetical protein